MSYLVNAPFGLKPWGNVLRVGLYAIATANTTAVYHGDGVFHGGTSYSTKFGQITGLADTAVVNGAAGYGLGAVVGLMDYKGDPCLYIPAATTGDGVIAGFALVADHPLQTFIIQEDSGTENIVASEIGYCAELVVGTGSTTTGVSGMALDSSTEATTATLALKIVALHPDDTISTGDVAATAASYNRFIVTFNAHFFGPNAAGI